MKTIGICGPSGSGKTTLAKMLCKDLDANLISLDNYFLADPPFKKYDEKGKNWELPENLDWLMIKRDIRHLQNRTSNTIAKFNWETEKLEEQIVEPKNHIIIEGFLLLDDTEIISMLDLSIYIHVPDHIGIDRRIAREKTAENKAWFEEVTFPEYAPRRKVFEERADLVINGELPLADNLERIRSKISEIRKALS